MPKKLKGGPLGLSRYGMLRGAEKEGNPFWFSSLGQLNKFGTIKIRRTFGTILVSSCGLKKRVTIIGALHFMKRRINIVF